MGALDGVRVLDLADESAVFATRILADLGADVLRLEPPDGGRVRSRAPFIAGAPTPEGSLLHLYHNANKRSLVLDLETKRGADRFRELVREADILVETAPPGSLERLELGYRHLKQINPSLIHVSVTPYGLHSPWRDRRTSDLVAAAAGGLLYVSGDPDGPPVQAAGDQSFKLAGLTAATGALVALTGRRLGTIAGVHLDVSVQECVAMSVLQTSNPFHYTWHGRVPGRPGLTAVFRCADGLFTTCNPRADRWAVFLGWVREAGVETDLTSDSWEAAQGIGQGVASNLVRQVAARYSRDEFLRRAWALDMLALPVNTLPDLQQCEQLLVNDEFIAVPQPAAGGTLAFPRSPVDAMAGRISIRAAPRLGESRDTGFATRKAASGGGSSHAGTAAAVLPPHGRSSQASGANPSTLLRGVRVVDFCWVLAGPLGSRLLANFGAQVIRVESASRPDSLRNGRGPNGERSPNIGGLFNDANTGKESIAVDLRSPSGRTLVRRLIEVADVVTNNFRPGALERFGFGFEALQALNPGIVLLNMPGCGRKGPWSQRGTMGNIVLGASGLSSITGFADQAPIGLGVAYPDFTSPYLLATCVLAALHQRERTGRGQEIDLSQLAATVSLIGVEWLQYQDSREAPRKANRDPNYCPHGVYPSAGDDEWVALAVEGEAQWVSFCRAIGRPELAEDPRFASHATRKQHEDALDTVVAGWTATRDRWETAELLQARGITAAAVENLQDTLERDPCLRSHYQIVHQPDFPDVPITIDGEAIRFEGVTHPLRRAPALGEHNEVVLCGLLGLSMAEFDGLVAGGVLM